MTTIASSSVQATVGQIVARILDRARLPADGATDAAPAAGPATAGGAVPRQPGRPAGNAAGPSTGATPGTAEPGIDVPPAPNGGPAKPVDGTSVILNALLSLANRALPMDINLNQLLNTATLKSPLTQLPAELLGKPQVIEAVVLRNTLLPSTPNNPQQPASPLLAALAGEPALESPTRYQVSMQWQGRVLQLVTPQPLPRGTTVQLQINSRGEVLLLPPALPGTLAGKGATPPLQAPAAGMPTGNAPAVASQSGAAATLAAMTRGAPQATAHAATPAIISLTMTSPQQAAQPAKPLPPQQTLQQSLREVLPRQESLHTLVPLLQKLIAPRAGASSLPEPIAKQLVQLLKSLPRPEQLQTGPGLKRAVENSGSFLEARLVRGSAPANPAAPNPEAPGKVLESDIKAQMNALLGAVRRLLPAVAALPQATEADAETALADELVYNPKQLQRGNPIAQRDDAIDAGDLQLAQLSKLLQSGLARIQLNQLDGAVSRHNNADPQLLAPAWVLELPLANTRGHSDNLQLRIEQRPQQHEARTRVQWNVQIAFDLHELGKIATTLSIVDRNVAATVWAERADTHRSVQEKIDYLRAGLESVGVKVTEMQCRLGMPPARASLISQQLVDLHT
jgi:hypothetical protein